MPVVLSLEREVSGSVDPRLPALQLGRPNGAFTHVHVAGRVVPDTDNQETVNNRYRKYFNTTKEVQYNQLPKFITNDRGPQQVRSRSPT